LASGERPKGAPKRGSARSALTLKTQKRRKRGGKMDFGELPPTALVAAKP